MDYSDMRRLLLKIFLGFLSLTALIAIFSVLAGDFGETQLKVLATTFSISAGSICAMGCAAFLERQGNRAFGVSGILMAGVAVALVTCGVWGEIESEDFWKTTVTCIVVAVAFAHGCLLQLPDLAPRHRWTQRVSVALITVLALQIILALWVEVDNEGYYRWLAVVSVLVVLMTLVVPICSRLRGAGEGDSMSGDTSGAASPGTSEPLVLHGMVDGTYADATGRRYRVTPVDAPADPPASPA